MIKNLRDKVMGAWLGKAVGGTLGQPWEGSCGPLNLTFYDPVPETMMPNDDLDLQILWACKLNTDWKGVVSTRNFERAWVENIAFPFDEYGVVIRNLKLGLHAPESGRYDNGFTDGLGAAIRSELWACLAPGNPEKAAQFAKTDACLDHDGNGIYAEEFLAALESQAFVETDLQSLIKTGLAAIPEDSTLAQAIRDTVQWCSETQDPAELRTRIMTHYGSANFTDVCMNLSFEVAALLLGNGDFGKSICLAVNFGQDTDCTGATVGSILGIRDPESIPEHFLKPIGRGMALSKEITGIKAPKTIEEFTDMVLNLREKVRLESTEELPVQASTLSIPCRVSDFAPWFSADYRKFKPCPGKNLHTETLPGNLIELDFSTQHTDTLRLLEMDFTLDKTERVRLLVNTPATVMVWVDGEYLFGRESGAMVPAFHRALQNQLVELELSARKHTLMLGVAPASDSMKKAPLLFGIAGLDNQWRVDPFRSRD